MYYVEEPPADLVLQGDIFRDFTITTIPDEFLVCRDGSNNETIQEGNVNLTLSQNLPDLFISGTEYITIKAIKTNILVVSQSCDAQNRDFVIIAPVFPLSRIAPQRILTVKENKIFYRFFLPAQSGVINDSYAELTILNSIPSNSLTIEKRLLSLTDFYRNHFTYHLNRFLCRPFMP